MILLLIKALGVRRVAGWALWLVRALLTLGLLAGGVCVVVFYPQERWKLLGSIAGGLVMLGIQALWRRRRKPEVFDAGERTIDGKVVPDKLAAAALAVPLRSPDGGAVLRGLPDYGKALLKLDSGDFQYVPGLAGPEPKLLLLEEPAASRPALGVPRWALVTGGVALLAVAGVGVGFYQASRDARPGYASVRDVPETPQPVSAAESSPQPAPPQLAPTPPPDSAAIPETAPAPAPAPAANSAPVGAEASRPAKDSPPGVLLTRVNPIYPQEAKAQHIEGVVVVNAVIGKTGEITEATVVSGPEELQKAALDAVKQWTYRPYVKNGEPLEVETTIRLKFTF